jgi:putative transposase
MFARHAGASRFAYNQCLRLVVNALAAKRAEPETKVPWSGFDLINAFNAWKRSESAGRVFVAAPDGTITKQVTGLGWRHEVSAQVFEEAAVDLGRALFSYGQIKNGGRKGRRAGFPRWKRKGRCRDSFRLRNQHGKGGAFSIRVGEGHPRPVTLPRIGAIRVHDNTRGLRRLLRPITPTPGSRWWRRVARSCSPRSAGTVPVGMSASLYEPPTCMPPAATRPAPLPMIMAGLSGWTAALPRSPWRHRGPRSAASRHPSRCNPAWCAYAGCPVGPPRPSPAPATGPRRPGGCPGSMPASPTCVVASSRGLQPARPDPRPALFGGSHRRQPDDQPAPGPPHRRRRLDRTGPPAHYKAAWFGAELVVCDRWFASTKTCSGCGSVKRRLGLAERILRCPGCGLTLDRDRNAAANLAAWAERSHAQAPDRQAGGRVTNAPGGEGTGHRLGDGETSPSEGGTDAHASLV